MAGTTPTPLNQRDRAVLRAVAAGRCRLSCEFRGSLLVDGIYLTDQFAVARLTAAGLIATAGTQMLQLTESGRALLEAA